MRGNRGWAGLETFSKEMYKERYFLPNENYDDWLERVASAYSDDTLHKLRIKNYIRNYWFHPSTPVSSNAGVPEIGLPISCYTNSVEDSKKGIFSIWTENNWLGSFGGGIGTSWSKVRALGEEVGNGGTSSGIIPFIKVSDVSTLAVSQGGLRRASQAVYLDISHPEIMEFIDLRRPTGDSNRRSPNMHHGITITDDFMEAVEKRSTWDLKSPKTGEVLQTVDAFDLFKKILISRVETGEPYLFFKDTANRHAPIEYKQNNRIISTSNLCNEIMLHTDENTTAVCCLVSLNLEYFDEWENDSQFIEDVHRYTDNILQSFIDLTKNKEGFEKARKGAIEERSIGIGVMGYHSLLQKKNLPLDCLSAKYLTDKVFSHIALRLASSNRTLAAEKGSAPISSDRRNVNTMAIAPTASISTLCNLSSPGIDPRISNVYTVKTNIGSYTIRNKYLHKKILEESKHYIDKEAWIEEQWKSIIKHDGSVQHLEWMDQDTKDVFKTAFEIDQLYIIDNVAIMQKYVSQGISTNLFIPSDIHVNLLYKIHMEAWKQELKGLYYVRSFAKNRANVRATDRKEIKIEEDTCRGCA